MDSDLHCVLKPHQSSGGEKKCKVEEAYPVTFERVLAVPHQVPSGEFQVRRYIPGSIGISIPLHAAYYVFTMPHIVVI